MLVRLFSFVFLLIGAACGSATERIEFSGQTMGTTYNIVVTQQVGDLTPEALQTTVEARLEAVNASYSNWDPQSEVSRFNSRESLDPVVISSGFRDMLRMAETVHDASDGKFDLTLRPVIELWGFGPSGRVTQQPEQDAIDRAMSEVGQNTAILLSADGGRLRKTVPGASIDLAAIAKGYGIDQIAAELAGLGVEGFMVEIGGDLYVSGQTDRDSPWRIGIERPDAGLQGVQQVIEFSDLGMATSGDYRNYFEEDGIRYSHIIDASTGRPITHRTASVTVLAGSAALADAWATALLALGVDAGLSIAEEEELAALFIVREENTSASDFKLVSSSHFERLQAAQED
ncbi:MAG: FAD:protein FMN transferase [Pseudomonadota bacterium]